MNQLYPERLAGWRQAAGADANRKPVNLEKNFRHAKDFLRELNLSWIIGRGRGERGVQKLGYFWAAPMMSGRLVWYSFRRFCIELAAPG